MDYHMPELDGCGATLGIREDEKARQLPRTPIVAVTASVLTDDKERCARAGMDDFLAKPIRNHALAAMLDKWLQQVTILETGNAQPIAPPVTPVPLEAALPTTLFDVAQLLEMREVSGGDFAALLERFYGNVHESVQALRAAYQTQDAAALHRVAHKLKGSSATLGACEMTARCLELETLGKSGAVTDAGVMIDALVQSYLRAKPYLDDCADSEEAA
jgi:HPt (histidine-containing phosphotransfer) domain-containing protein